MRDEFSTLDIVKALGIPRERLRDWMNQGFIKPKKPAEGQGTRAIFIRNDVYAVELFRRLVKFGLRRESASLLLDSVRIEDISVTYLTPGPLRSRKVRREAPGMVIFFNDNKIFNFEVFDPSFFQHYFISGGLGKVRDPSKKPPKSGSLLKFFLEGNEKEGWDQILILNFEKIRGKVDTALSVLG